MMSERERKNKRVGMAVSLSVHLAVLLLFAFLMAWRAPDPPLPEYGIELNFGTSDVGTGDIQPPEKAIPGENVEDSKPEELPEVQEEVVEESQDAPVDDDVQEEATQTDAQVDEVFEDEQSSDVVEKEEKVKEEVNKVQKVEKETKNPPKPEEEKKEVEQPVEKIIKPDNKAETGAKGVEGETEKAANANQGDKTDETGDQGNEKGVVDARALYGNPGGGGGSSLQLAGWIWDFKPEPNDTSNEAGRIVFEITIDDQGEIISIRTVEKTVSPSVEKIYRDEIEKLTFSKTDNRPPAPTSKGRITFIIKAR